MLKRISDRAQEAASAATSAVSNAAEAATNAATTAASAAANAASSAASAATNAATSAVTAATSGIQNLGLDTLDEESINSKVESDIEELTKVDLENEKDAVSKEEKFITSIEDGEVSVFMDMLYRKEELDLDIDNVKDANGLTPLRLAIVKGYSGIVELLLNHGANVGDALLRAVEVGFLETVKIIVEFAESLEESQGREYTRGILECRCDDDDYHPDVTPIVLAAQKNAFAIVKVLSEAGCKIRSIARKKSSIMKSRKDSLHPDSQATDDLQKSVGALEVYRGLASKAYLILGNEDPIEAAFKLSKKLRDLGHKDVEHKPEFDDLADGVDEVSPELISYARSTEEILTILTYYDENEDANTKGGPLPKITKAIEVEQKRFVAHPNCQQAVLAKFYGQQAFLRDEGSVYRVFYLLLLILGFPFLSLAYLYLPIQRVKDFMKCPYTKFALKLASDLFFVTLLTIDNIVQPGITNELVLSTPTKGLLLVWILGIFWNQIKLMYRHGKPKLTDVAQWRDILLVVLFLFGILFDLASYLEYKKDTAGATSEFRRDLGLLYSQPQKDVETLYNRQPNFTMDLETGVQRGSLHHRSARATKAHLGQGTTTTRNYSSEEFLAYIVQEWWEPRLIASALFALSSVISFLRMLQYVIISDTVGPFQISLGSMVTKTANFFVVVAIVLFSFAIGLTYLYSYYMEVNALTCGGSDGVACSKDRFSHMGVSSLYLFWSIIGVEDQEPLLLPIQAGVIENAGQLLYALFYILMVIVLLNALIAVMSEAYTSVEENADVEWKFHSTVMWMGILLDDDVVQPPFNLLPSVKSIKSSVPKRISSCFGKKESSDKKEEPHQEEIRNYTNDMDDKAQYKRVIDKLVERYVTAKNEVSVNAEVTIADVLALKNDLQGLKLQVSQKLFETNHQVHLTTDVGFIARDISKRAKRVLNKAEAIHDDVDGALLKLIVDFKDYVVSKREIIKKYVDEMEEEEPPPGIFSQLIDSFGNTQKEKAASPASVPRTNANKGTSVKDHHRGTANESTTRKKNAPDSPNLLASMLCLVPEFDEDEIPRDDAVTNQIPSTNGRLLPEVHGSAQEPALNVKTKEEATFPKATDIFSTLIDIENFLNNSGSSEFGTFASALVQAGDTIKLIEETGDQKKTAGDDGKIASTEQEMSLATAYPDTSHDGDRDSMVKFQPIEPAKTTKVKGNESRVMGLKPFGNTHNNASIETGSSSKTSQLSEESVRSSLQGKNGNDNTCNETKEKNTNAGFFLNLPGTTPTTSEATSGETDDWTDSSSQSGDESDSDTDSTATHDEMGKHGSILKPSIRSPVTVDSPKLTNRKSKTTMPNGNNEVGAHTATNGNQQQRNTAKEHSGKVKKRSISRLVRKAVAFGSPKLMKRNSKAAMPMKGRENSEEVVPNGEPGQRKQAKGDAENGKRRSLSRLVRKTVTFEPPKLAKRNSRTATPEDNKKKTEDVTNGKPQLHKNVQNDSENDKKRPISKPAGKTVALEPQNLAKRNSRTATPEVNKRKSGDFDDFKMASW